MWPPRCCLVGCLRSMVPCSKPTAAPLYFWCFLVGLTCFWCRWVFTCCPSRLVTRAGICTLQLSPLGTPSTIWFLYGSASTYSATASCRAGPASALVRRGYEKQKNRSEAYGDRGSLADRVPPGGTGRIRTCNLRSGYGFSSNACRVYPDTRHLLLHCSTFEPRPHVVAFEATFYAFRRLQQSSGLAFTCFLKNSYAFDSSSQTVTSSKHSRIFSMYSCLSRRGRCLYPLCLMV